MSSIAAPARDGALAKLAAEAARFAAGPTRQAIAADTSLQPTATRPAADEHVPTTRTGPAGYVPVAVAPERGNTRPVVPVDGRVHMRMAQVTIDALDDAVRMLRASDPSGLRDLERATLIRVAVALALTDVDACGADGAVGEAVRAALDPAVRHTATPMPALSRWLRTVPAPGRQGGEAHPIGGAELADAASGSRRPG